MKGQCNRISLDTGALMQDLTKRAEQAMKLEGNSLIHLMAHELHLTTHGGAPGKPTWRDEIERNLGHVATTVTAEAIFMDFGFSTDNLSDEVWAMLIAYGSGNQADGGGTKIHAGPTGRSVWDDNLAGKHPSAAESTYDLPDEFNQKGNHFIGNAMKRAQAQYGNMVVKAFEYLPDRVYYEKVRVKPP